MLETTHSASVRLFLCVGIATLAHLATGILLPKNLSLLPKKVYHSIPVQIVLPAPAAMNTQAAPRVTPESQSVSPAAITTTSSSSVTTAEKPSQPQPSNLPRTPVAPQITSPVLPDFRSRLTNTSTPSSAMSDFAELFKRKAVVAENVQISTNNENPLDSYELQLLKKVVESQFGNRLYPFRSMTERRQLTIEIRLLNNGQVLKATIIHSSGDARLDAAAVTGALNASPYPEPPAKDAEKDFRYLVPIIYEPVDT